MKIKQMKMNKKIKKNDYKAVFKIWDKNINDDLINLGLKYDEIK